MTFLKLLVDQDHRGYSAKPNTTESVRDTPQTPTADRPLQDRKSAVLRGLAETVVSRKKAPATMRINDDTTDELARTCYPRKAQSGGQCG